MRQGSALASTGGGIAPAAPTSGRSPAARITGRVHFWQGGSLWIGTGKGRADWHDHHAHQITISLEGWSQFRTGAGEPWRDCEGAVVPSHEKHQFQAEGSVAHFFVEPETVEGRALRAQCASSGLSTLSSAQTTAARQALASAWQRNAGIDETVSVARGVVMAITQAKAPEGAIDPRLDRAIAYLRCRMRDASSLAQVAAVATMSPSRFRHLFVQETGSSFRAYVLWLRLQVAIEAAMAGASWTKAAHEAGFADSAHLTRTFRRMFGINPTTLVTG